LTVRVLHIIQNLAYGGMERLLADLVLRSDPARIESHVLALEYLGRFAEGLEDKATLHVGPSMTRLSLARPAALARTIREIAPDVVHLHSGVWYKASLAARMAGVKAVLHTEHGRQSPDPWLARFLDGQAARRTDVAVAVSDSVADILDRRVVRGRCRIRVILNGVDTAAYAPRHADTDTLASLEIPPGTPVLGSIGRLEPVKGYDVMVHAFAELLATHAPGEPPILVLAGDGSEMGRLRELARERDVEDRMRFLGWRDDVHELLSCFTVFTMSSHSEGTSVSLLEAMSSGVPPVVTRVGGNPEVLGPELAHALVPPDAPGALAAAWASILPDPDRLERDAVRARERVVERYSVRRMVDEYVELYIEEAG
jgi:glycosyltransferase involved in cell wall biosynthesis